MINIEKLYKITNIFALSSALFIAGMCWAADVSWWYVPMVALVPTILFLITVVLALLWSVYLTKKNT